MADYEKVRTARYIAFYFRVHAANMEKDLDRISHRLRAFKLKCLSVIIWEDLKWKR